MCLWSEMCGTKGGWGSGGPCRVSAPWGIPTELHSSQAARQESQTSPAEVQHRSTTPPCAVYQHVFVERTIAVCSGFLEALSFLQ